MNIDVVEGALDKSETGLRAILLSQAKLRVLIALPVVVIETFLYVMAPEAVASRLVALTVGYCAYVLTVHFLVRYQSTTPASYLLAATAVLDPLALSAWLLVTGEYGSLIVGFYLFTILGFGFRTGRPLMYLCQVAAISSFAVVLLIVPFWQQHPVVWCALLLPLIAVPIYSGTLIRRLREAREHAERESQAKSELLAKVSHELRTPLTGIISATELLAAEAGQENVTKRTETILALSNELLHEINDLLDEAKYSARASDLVVAPVDLNDQITRLKEALEATASGKGIEFIVELDPRITDRFETDGRMLGRVLMNLASNAVKFTDHGRVRLDIDLVDAEANECRLRFSVTDTGIGIPESFRARIFEPFSQVEQGVNRRYGGTGLGLALCRRIVASMGGDLQFESTPGRGTRFWFELTLRRSAQPVRAPSESAPVLQAEVSPRRILVAEDNETNRLLLQELLEKDGHVVATCASGMEAIELLAEQDFDLLLLDYNLGDMDGVRVLQTYRFGRRHAAPALFLTADTTGLTASRLRQANGAGVLYKPISLTKLRKAILDLEDVGATTRESFEQVSEVAAPVKPARPVLTAVSVDALDRSVIDELKTVSSRPEFFPRLMAEAENDMVRSSQLILEALAQMNHASLRDAAHALKGVSANVGAVRLLALATNLMTTPREELEAARGRWTADVNDALRLTLIAMKKEVHDAGEHPSGSGTASLHLH